MYYCITYRVDGMAHSWERLEINTEFYIGKHNDDNCWGTIEIANFLKQPDL